MSNAYSIWSEFSGSAFEYGDLEDRIGFIFDNYYAGLKLYRIIKKQMIEDEKKRSKAHETLQKLRDDENRWAKSKQVPQDFDAKEHDARKEHLTELREEEFPIMINGQPMMNDKLSSFIINHMWLYKTLDMIDLKSRKRLGHVSKRALMITLWPMLKMMELTARHTDSYQAEKMLKKNVKKINKLPEMLEKKIVNP